MKSNKLLALLLTVAMLFTMSMTAFANNDIVAEVGTSDEFITAISASSPATIIKLKNDITLSVSTNPYNPTQRKIEKNCTIDLGEYTLDKGNVEFFYTGANNIKITGVKGKATIKYDGASSGVFYPYSGSVLTFENITFSKVGTSYVYGVVNSNGATEINMNNCDLTNTGSSQSVFVDNSSNTIFSIKDTAVSTTGRVFQNGTYVISGKSTVSGSAGGNVSVWTVGDDVTISGVSSNRAVALSAGTYYGTLASAFENATDGATITLLSDTNVNSSDMQLNKAVTIDLAGHKIDVTTNTATMYITKNVTFTSSTTKKGVIDISNARSGQGVWSFNSDEPITLTMNNVKIERDGIVAVGSGVFESIQLDGRHKVKLDNCEVDLSATSGDDLSGRFMNYVSAEITDTTIELNKFTGAFASGNIKMFGTSSLDIKDSQYAVNNSKLEMNDNSKITATNCSETAIKLGKTSSIDLNDTSNLTIKNSQDGDIRFRSEVTDEEKQNITIDVAQTAVLSADLSDVVGGATITGKAFAISVEFEATENPNEYNIVLTAPISTLIHEFTSAQLQFVKGNDEIGYEIVEENDKISVNEQGNDIYLFNLKNGENIVGNENKIVIGKVVFDGYSDSAVDFKVNEIYDNKVIATKGQNLTDTFNVENGKLTVNDEEKGIIDAIFAEPKCEVTINVAMNEPVVDNKVAYQDMKVVVSGADLAEPIVFNLGTDGNVQNDNNYKVTATLKQDKKYVITVTGAGYRKAQYTLKTKGKETATVNFWNNVQLASNELEMETGIADSKVNANFIAGDIVKDNKLNIYDLSAVVAYFGDSTTDTTNAWDKAKYDLNRDGKIDATDVSIVLDAWKALDKLGQN